MILTGLVEAYKRFEIHDGPGVRTTVFLKGCPLSCKWCHNPECIPVVSVLGYSEQKCISCGECIDVCQRRAHGISNGAHVFDRSKCTACGKCEEVCLGDALKLHGRRETVDSVVARVKEDKAFYGKTGGVTISGGEPLLQAEFVFDLLRRLKTENFNTALDTCLYAESDTLKKLLPFTDLFLVDIKALDEDVHIHATGRSNKKILKNIGFLAENGADVEFRIPYVPGYNGNQIEKIACFIERTCKAYPVKLLPYHDFANNKYTMIGKHAEKIPLPDAGDIDRAKRILKSHGLKVLEQE